jgi:hypothetical protein
MKTCILPGTILLLATSILAADSAPKPESASAAGKWRSEFDTPVGHLVYVYELKVSGDKLTGTAVREREGVKSEIELKEGTINGAEVCFVEPIKIQDEDIRIEYKGKLSGDEIKFTRKVADLNTTEIVARRIKGSSAPVDGKWTTEFDSQIGKQKYTFELKTSGDKLSGKAIGESQFGQFDTVITDGKSGPEGIAFVETLKLPDREIKIDYAGKLVGDELKLTRKVGDFATEEIVAKRVQTTIEK